MLVRVVGRVFSFEVSASAGYIFLNCSATRVIGRLRTSSPSTGKKSGGVAGFAAGKTTELKQAAQFKKIYPSLAGLLVVVILNGLPHSTGYNL